MDNIEAGNTLRINRLENCVPQLEARMQVIDERTGAIFELVKELKDDIRSIADEAREMAMSHAANQEKWTAYEKDKDRLEREFEKLESRIREIEALAQNNRLTLAKIAGVGATSGAAVSGLISLIKWILSQQP